MSGTWASGWTRHRVEGHGHRIDDEMKWPTSEVKELITYIGIKRAEEQVRKEWRCGWKRCTLWRLTRGSQRDRRRPCGAQSTWLFFARLLLWKVQEHTWFFSYLHISCLSYHLVGIVSQQMFVVEQQKRKKWGVIIRNLVQCEPTKR